MADTEKLRDGTLQVNMGYESVRLAKMYGPTIFADLTVQSCVEGDRAEWIIYRDGVEWVRIPAQLDSDFSDDPQAVAED
jgi:hypothetical protein